MTHAQGRAGRARLMGAALVAAALLAGGTACSGSDSGSAKGSTGGAAKGSDAAKAEVFGPKGYRGIAPGATKDAALASGALQTAPMSALTGCSLFSYKDGPTPDPAVIAAEGAAAAKSKELGAKADQAKADADAKHPGPGASAAEFAADAKRSAEVAQLMADSTDAIADELRLQATRDKAFEAAGGAKFGGTALKQLIAPQKARTAEGIGAGSTEAELKAAYPQLESVQGGYRRPIEGSPDWELFFATDGSKVLAVSLFDSAVKCL